MNETNATTSTRNSIIIKAAPDVVYRAFLDPKALTVWQAPGNMTARVHEFDERLGGGYEMSLFYPMSEQMYQGKTSAREDRFRAQFLELMPSKRIVKAITFKSADAAFSGKMFMIVTLEERGGWTKVTVLFENIPSGIRPEDSEAGTQSSLEKLASYLEERAGDS